MANDNNPRGLIPVNLGQGNLSAHYYRVSTGVGANVADIYLGSPVLIDSDGFVKAGSVTGALPVLGVALNFAGVLKRGLATNDPFLDSSDLAPPTPSSDTGDRWVLVSDDPNQEYLVQEDTGGTALALTDVGAACDLIYRGATATAPNGNADNGWANLELDASGVVATLSAPVQILRLHDAVNSDGTENAVGDYAKWVVKFLHPQKAGDGFNIAGYTGPIV